MAKKIHVATSPLSNNIYAGSTLKNSRMWGANKTDVTNEVVCAFVDHAIEFKKRTGKDIELSVNGVPVVRVTIEELNK